MSSAKKILTVAIAALAISSAYAEESSEIDLENRLNELSLPSNVAPASVRQEKLYSVQNRYSDLTHRSEINLGGGRTLTGNSFVNMSQIDLTYRYHLSNRWNLSVTGSYGFNSLTEGGEDLFITKKMLPDATYVKTRAALLAAYNLFYGKFRLSMDNVMYFDQYVAVGPGFIQNQYGSSPAAIVDVGMAFYTGPHMSFRFGFRNDFFNEKRRVDTGMEHHLLGHLALGYTFGGEGT